MATLALAVGYGRAPEAVSIASAPEPARGVDEARLARIEARLAEHDRMLGRMDARIELSLEQAGSVRPAVDERRRALDVKERLAGLDVRLLPARMPPPPKTDKAKSANSRPKARKATSPSEEDTPRVRFQVLALKDDRLYYRSVDQEVYVARPGQILQGVNGRYVRPDGKGRVVLVMNGQTVSVPTRSIEQER